VDQPPERDEMTSNVIKFPTQNRVETIEIETEFVAEENGNDFGSEIIEYIHDVLHEKTGECIFTDEQYRPLVICLGEILTALHMFTQGHDTHPFYEIANEIFGEKVDIAEEVDYTGENENNEET
jgi:hypothetical protein